MPPFVSCSKARRLTINSVVCVPVGTATAWHGLATRSGHRPNVLVRYATPRALSALLSMPSFCFLRVTISPCVRLYRLHVLNRCCPAWHVCSWLSVMSLPDYPPAYAVRPLTVLSALWCSAHHAGDQIGLYETMYCPQIHMFYAIADTNAEVIRVERHVRELNAGICFLLCVSVRSWCLSQVHRHHLSVKV